MKNIIWQKPDGEFAITGIADPAADSTTHAAYLKSVGAIPFDWIVSAVDAASPPKTLTAVKSKKLEELKTAWYNTQNLGISTRGKTFAVGGQARAQLDRLLAAQANGITIPTTIRADDGTPIDFTAVTIKGLYDMIIKTERIAEDNYWAKRALVEAATTVPQVEAISW